MLKIQRSIIDGTFWLICQGICSDNSSWHRGKMWQQPGENSVW